MASLQREHDSGTGQASGTFLTATLEADDKIFIYFLVPISNVNGSPSPLYFRRDSTTVEGKELIVILYTFYKAHNINKI